MSLSSEWVPDDARAVRWSAVLQQPASGPAEVPPGSLVGVIGGGQLGRMFVDAAHSLGYRVAVLTDSAGSPAGTVADVAVVGSPRNRAVVRAFARRVSALTYENESVPWECLADASQETLVRPGPSTLRVSQDRELQRRLMGRLGIAVPAFVILSKRSELDGPIANLRFPARLKVRQGGYDGTAQRSVPKPSDLYTAWATLDYSPVLVEEQVEVDSEFSVILARGAHGEIAEYEPIRNYMTAGILDLSVYPAVGIPEGVLAKASTIARRVAIALDLTGVLCVEFFFTRDGALLVNEFATRPHNSGHLTICASQTSQFEQQVRALVGTRLGTTEMRSPAAMANVIGNGEPPLSFGPGDPVELLWYGKEPRPGRKLGHLTALRPLPVEAVGAVVAARMVVTGDPRIV